jgi:hypothetical protein
MIISRRKVQRIISEAVITGRKLDRYSTVIRRHVINAVKDDEVRDHFNQTGEATFKLQNVPELDDIDYLRDVWVSLEAGQSSTHVGAHASYEFDLDATPEQRKTSDLNVTVVLPQNFEDRVLGTVHEELTDAIRHELEHSGQETEELMDCQRKVPDAQIWATLGKARSYYLCPAEKKAHVAGFMKRAKQRKQPAAEVMDEELMAIYQTGLHAGFTDEEVGPLMSDMRAEYQAYLKERYPNVKLEGYERALRNIIRGMIDRK